MNTKLVRPRSLSHRFAAAAALGLACSFMLVQAAPEPSSPAAEPATTLRVGLDYVIPPFVGGSKVRTPETIDTALAEKLADKLALPLQSVPAQSEAHSALPASGWPRVTLAVVPKDGPIPASMVAVPTGYTVAPMAIMRTDTDIKSWEQLKDRTVCLSEGGRHVGAMAARYGAKEMVYRAPADALLALRIGECDAAVHDDVMLRALLKLPEWKKFSAALTGQNKQPLVFLADSHDADMVAALNKLTREWKSKRALAALTKTRVNDIAFEVYLDQVVPDCH